jgi:hypothetical protein
MTFMISLKACSNQIQDLPWSEMPESVARAAKSWPRITLTFAASIFCTPQEKLLWEGHSLLLKSGLLLTTQLKKTKLNFNPKKVSSKLLRFELMFKKFEVKFQQSSTRTAEQLWCRITQVQPRFRFN